MHAHPKLRRIAKWGGLTLAAVSVLAWVWSLYSITGWITQDGSIWALRRGRVSLSWRSPSNAIWGVHGAPLSPGAVLLRTRFSPTEGGFEWRFGPTEGVAAVPLWAPAGAGLLVAAVGWGLGRRARRRIAAGACLACGYDRSTLPPASPCPECGAAGR